MTTQQSTVNVCGFCGENYTESMARPSALQGLGHVCDAQKKTIIATSESAKAKAQAAESAAGAIHAIEAAVQATLNGQFLKGLPNLGTGTDGYRAINVRAKDQTQKFALDRERPYLVIDRAGLLSLVTYGREEIVEEVPVIANLPPSDLPSIVAGYRLAIARHMKKLEVDTAAYRRIDALGSGVCRAMQEAMEQFQ
jgi:hypothetical protein